MPEPKQRLNLTPHPFRTAFSQYWRQKVSRLGPEGTLFSNDYKHVVELTEFLSTKTKEDEELSLNLKALQNNQRPRASYDAKPGKINIEITNGLTESKPIQGTVKNVLGDYKGYSIKININDPPEIIKLAVKNAVLWSKNERRQPMFNNTRQLELFESHIRTHSSEEHPNGTRLGPAKQLTIFERGSTLFTPTRNPEKIGELKKFLESFVAGDQQRTHAIRALQQCSLPYSKRSGCQKISIELITTGSTQSKAAPKGEGYRLQINPKDDPKTIERAIDQAVQWTGVEPFLAASPLRPGEQLRNNDPEEYDCKYDKPPTPAMIERVKSRD